MYVAVRCPKGAKPEGVKKGRQAVANRRGTTTVSTKGTQLSSVAPLFCFGPSFTPSGFAPLGQLSPIGRKPQLVFPSGQRTSVAFALPRMGQLWALPPKGAKQQSSVAPATKGGKTGFALSPKGEQHVVFPLCFASPERSNERNYVPFGASYNVA